MLNSDSLSALYNSLKDVLNTASRPKGTGARAWSRTIKAANKQLDDALGPASKLAKGLKLLPYITLGIDVLWGAYENYQNGVDGQRIVTDAIVDTGFGIGGGIIASAVSSAVAGAVAGSVAPGVGNLIGLGVGFVTGVIYYGVTELIEYNGKSLVDWAKEKVDWMVDGVGSLFNEIEEGIGNLWDTLSGWFD